MTSKKKKEKKAGGMEKLQLRRRRCWATGGDATPPNIWRACSSGSTNTLHTVGKLLIEEDSSSRLSLEGYSL